MHSLPINSVLPDIKHGLSTHSRLVLQAPPGAGKTTAVPLALLDESWLDNKLIIVLEPRRLAARNAANRMATLLNEKVGETVGYQIRQDNCFSNKTRILVVTEGILTRKIQADPELLSTALVIFDEFHERSLHADLSLALCLQSQQVLNESLKILVMSATLNTTAIAELLGDVPIIQSEGRSFPVDIRYLDKPINKTGSSYANQQQRISAILQVVKRFISDHTGSCLVFLPGVKEINRVIEQTSQYIKAENINNIILVPLHGSLNKQQQDQAILSPAKNARKIVFSTNIAETSLTIEGISCVIDSGLERILQHNNASGMNGLVTHFISADSAEQRSGRAGRLSPGTCYRLWTEQQQQRLVKHSIPEILHSDLSALMLELANWGVQSFNELNWLDTPPVSTIVQANTLLNQLNAVKMSEHGVAQITQHGRNILRLGAHPRLAHMMLSAITLNQAYHACLIASVISEKDLFLSSATKTIDIQDRLNILTRYKQDKNRLSNFTDQGVDIPQCQRIIQTADDFLKRLKISNDIESTVNSDRINSELTGVLLAYAYPERIAKQRHSNTSRYLMSNGKGAVIPTHLQLHTHEFLVVASLDSSFNKEQGEASIYLASEIAEKDIEEYLSELIQYSEKLEWNDLQQRVEVKKISNIGKIVLRENLIKPDTNEDISVCLINAIRNIGLDCLSWSSKAINFRQRVNFINKQLSGFLINESVESISKQFIEMQFPDFSDEELSSSLFDWFLPHLTNENSIKDCKKLDLYSILKNQLTWEQQQLVDTLAPEKLIMPSGSAISIDYTDSNQPVLAVRLQEVFGLYETPTLFKGHCRVMMHLLSPAHRPMQITQDLYSFWQTTYHEVKKELRGKYKRHYWPDDPFTAQATSKTKKNMHK